MLSASLISRRAGKETETGDQRIAVRWAKLLRTPERADPLPLALIGQPAETCSEVILHVRGTAGRRDHTGDRSLGKDIFQEQLSPAGTVEFGRPLGQRAPAYLAE